MLPLRDTNPSATYPIVNNVIIGVCVLVYILEITYGGGRQAFIYQYGLVPARVRLFSLFSYMFLHGGFWHLLFNMWYLYIFGDNIEDRLGPTRYLVFYIGCGLVSGLAHLALNLGAPIPIVGASGAIAGVMGAYLVLFPHSKVLTLVPLFIIPFFVEIPAFFLLGVWFVIQLLNAASTAAGSGGVAWWAHVGGFIAGIVFLKIFGVGTEQVPDNRYRKMVSRRSSPRLQVIRPGGGLEDPDLYGNITITSLEALTGTTKTVNIPWGFQSRLYRVNVPAGVKPGATLRLKGLGKQRPDGSAGDLYLKVTTR